MSAWRMPEAFYGSDKAKKQFIVVCHHSFLGLGPLGFGEVVPVVLFEA